MSNRIVLFLCFFSCSQAYSMFLGVGFHSHTSGRLVPSLNGGFNIGKDYIVSGTSSGVATKAYYSNQYSLSFLYRFDFGSHWFGTMRGGMGIGGVYGTKGYVADPDETPVVELNDIDSGLGPAFRISFNPLNHMYFALDYVLAMGKGTFGNGWGEVGMLALGWEL